ncbi:hypothetical protein [Fusibacter ferrireducens]|uniref:Uncharacterized protein n=1 Tax=Fusibacter ferrireducens TaxID=2785058 RepID=A0ABR9ZXD9_9FIRM|nr:hypothetical protein [Fusibacter ferrireducens]MBF4695126.1 hypothetical protein [Fusibacter ferrireducens]
MTAMKKRMKPNMNLLLLTLMLSLLMVLAYAYWGQVTMSTSFSLQFEGIEKGLNPDNTRFDYSEIISENALRSVFELSQIEYKDQYRQAIEVSPILPVGIVETIEQKHIDGEDYTYFPSEFVVRIKPSAEIGLSKQMSYKLAENYKQGFENYFIKKNTYPYVDIQREMVQYNLSDYDYPEYSRLFESDYNRLLNHLKVLEAEAPEYIGADQLSFRDLMEGIRLSQKLDLQKMNSIISTYKLSKDKDQLKIKYAYMIRRYELEKNKSFGQYSVNQELLNIVKSNTSTVMLPSVTGENLAFSVVNDTYDILAKKATESQVDAVTLDEEILDIQKKITELDSPEVSLVKLSQARKEVDAMALDLKTVIQDWGLKVNSKTQAYFTDKYSNLMTSVYGVQVNRNISPLKVIGSIFVIWFVTTAVFSQILLFRKRKTAQKKVNYRHVSD